MELARMKYMYSKFLASCFICRQDIHRNGSRSGKSKVQGGPSSDQKVADTNQMHRNEIKACWTNCCFF